MFSLKRRKIEKLQASIARKKEEVKIYEKDLKKEIKNSEDKESPLIKLKQETLVKKQDQLIDMSQKLAEAKESLNNSTLAKLKQAGDIIVETKKMVDSAQKTLKTAAVIGGVTVGVVCIASTATIVTCCKLTGKNTKLLFKRKKK